MNKIKLFIFVVFSFLQCISVRAQDISAETIYKYAKSKNYNALSYLRSYFEVQDSKGNTALCLAIIDDDYETYSLLRQYGANSQPYCLQSAIAASGSGTFLGMGSTGWLITGGVVAAGAGIAAAAGGGGGGGSSSSEESGCVHGTINDDKCICDEGWAGSSCATAISCPYNTTSCTGGYEESGNTCKSGNTMYKECKAKTVPDGYTKNSCGNGYTQIDTFLSGKDTYYKCAPTACTGYDYTACPNGYESSGTCLSGTTTKHKCSPAACTGYATSCGSGYHMTTDTCLSGTTTMYKCEADACEGYNYTACPNGYESSGTCLSGATTKHKCAPAACTGFDYTTCPNGYESSGTCLSGTTTKHKCSPAACTGYATSCGSGYHMTTDTCLSGTTTLYKCEADACEGYVDGCGTGYHVIAGDTCKSGEKTKVKCEINDCSSYKTDCEDGYNKVQSCISGTTPYYTCTPKDVPVGYTDQPCGEGYTQINTFLSGSKMYYECEPNACTGYVENCGEGYRNVPNDTCKSGSKIMVKCEANDCSAYQASCGAGYDKTQSCLSGTTPYYTCTPKTVPDGYTDQPCGEGYTQINTFPSGEDIYYECKENDCEGYVTECTAGQKPTGRTCKSGKVTLVECKDAGCEDYPLSSVPQNCKTYSQCPSNQNKYRCDKCSASYGRNGSGECVKQSSALTLISDDQNNSVKETINNGYRVVYGLTNDNSNEHYNAYNHDAIIKITNNSDASSYGVNSVGSYSYNAYADSTSVSSGKIEIYNNGNGGAYGLQGVYGAMNAQTRSGSVEGNIKIVNKGNGNIYGMQTTLEEISEGQIISNTLVQNAESVGGTAIALIDIENTGSGLVHGMHSSSTGINALSNSNGASNGTIKINNSGDGEVRGISAEYLAQNTTSKMAESEAEIIIENVGNGDVTGIYSNGYAHNASGYTQAETTGSIVIKNRGDGSIVAITSADTRSSEEFNTAFNNNSGKYYYYNDIISYHLYNARANNATSYGLIDIQDEGNGDITVFDTIIQNKEAFATYTGNVTFNTYAINSGTAESSIKIKNESSDEEKKTIVLSKDTLNLAYAENKGKAINNIEIENDGYKDILMSEYDDSGVVNASKMTAKDNSSIENNIKIRSKGNGDIILPILASSNNSTINNTIDIDNQGNGKIKAEFIASTGNNKKINNNIKVKNNGNGDVEIKNNTGSSSAKVENKVDVDDTGDGNINIDVTNSTANGSGKTVNNEISIAKNGNGSVFFKHSQDYATATDGGAATSKIDLNLSGNNTFSWQGNAVTLASASGSSKASSAVSELNIVRNDHYKSLTLPTFNLYADGLGEVDNKIDINNISSGDLSLSLSATGNGKISNTVTVKNNGNGNIGIDFSTSASQLVENDFNIINDGNGFIKANITKAQTTITNKGNGNIYGISSGAVNGTIVINNTDRGRVYGMYGSSNGNMYNVNSSATASSTIKINNNGNGKAYGMYDGGGVNLYNAYTDTSSGTATGTISITNNGDGDAYAMYGGRFLYNAYINGTATGTIRIFNIGRGNGYGMYGGEYVYNNTYNDDSGKNKTSLIEMANVGSGLVVGMYAKDGTISNSGDVKIHNLADGAAVGIYADGTTEATNSGNIIIDRNSYTGDDITYSSNSEKGGKAIGMYGTSDATLTNSGTIKINGADEAYGIWSEGSKVNNTGTILIDGKYTENAIRLNGGKLVQNGTLIVGADWSNNGESAPACGKHGYLKNGECICDDGYIVIEGICRRIGTVAEENLDYIDIENNDDTDVYGMYSSDGSIYNYDVYGTISSTTGTISIINNGSGNAYGMYGKYAYNYNNGEGKTSLIEMVNAGEGLAVGMYAKDGSIKNSSDIKIHNLADGIAVGIYADGTTTATNSGNIIIDRGDITSNGGKAIGMYGTSDATLTNSGTIKINGADEAYGIWSEGSNVNNTGTIIIDGDEYTENAIRLNGGQLLQNGTLIVGADWSNNGFAAPYCDKNNNYIIVNGICTKFLKQNYLNEEIGNNENITYTNTYDKGIIGLYNSSSNTMYNAYNSSTTGTISITNHGNGDVYGMYDFSGAGMYNAYKYDRNVTGIISIGNHGNGDVYGMYSSNAYMYNAFGRSGVSTADGIINITNTGSGNVYGIYGRWDIYNSKGSATGKISIINNGSGNAYGMHGKNVHNQTEKTSLVEMANIRDGLAVGLYAKNGTIENSGDIKIHNQGDGVAVGVYADGNTTATNSGNIIIDREEYTNNMGTEDEADDVIYTAQSERGGLAIGIFGASGSTITNSGTITINGANDAYGIWSEGSNVTNIGTIVIGGDANHKNSIVLNGGKLLQDGVMNVSSSTLVEESGCAEGMMEFRGRCYSDLHCGNHSTQFMDTCICDNGYDPVNGVCQPVGLYVYNNNSDITIINRDDLDVYGMYGNSIMYNAYNTSSSDTATGTISITNHGNSNVYGMYGNGIMNNAYNTSSSDTATGTISIINHGNGNVYGMYTRSGSEKLYNVNSYYGKTTGTISITNHGIGDVYGMYSSSDVNMYNAYGPGRASEKTANGIINITSTGGGNIYGMYGNGKVFNSRSSVDSERGVIGKINIVNNGNGNAYGMHGKAVSNNNGDGDESLIEMANVGSGLAVGMYANNGSIYNSGDIKIHNLADGVAVGIYVNGYKYAYNSGNITIDRNSYTLGDTSYTAKTEKGGKAIGIYLASDSGITNDGKITISGANKSYGIYAEAGATVTNTGKISINGRSCTGDNCGSENNAIVLNGAALFQDGELIVSSNTSPQSVNVVPMSATSALPLSDIEDTTTPVLSENIAEEPVETPVSVESKQGQEESSHTPASLNLNDFGGTVVASDTSKFIVEGAISGDLAINNNVIENGFDTTYAVNGMIEAADTSGLNLISQSALFDATLENNTDAVMTMKSFDSVVNNNSLADFLQNNYAEENNEQLFRTLKGVETVAQLNDTLDELSGKSMFSRMAFEDLSMLREVSFDMNGKLFKENGAYALSGNVSPANYDNNAGSVGRYSLNGFNDGKRSFGFGVSITDVHTNDRNSDNRRFDRNFMMSAPLGYKTHGFELITAPKAGYSDGTYNRDGFDDMSYEGKVQKRMFALMNEARYPFKFGGLKLTPSAEFNMIGYNVRGHENESEYSLRIKSQNHYSVEAGFGLMAEKEFKMPRKHKFGLNGGVAMYHEFANPYELEVSMNGTNGTFKIRDERRKDNRAVLRSGFDYDFGEDLSLVGSIAAYIDGTNNTNANLDFKYAF